MFVRFVVQNRPQVQQRYEPERDDSSAQKSDVRFLFLYTEPRKYVDSVITKAKDERIEYVVTSQKRDY